MSQTFFVQPLPGKLVRDPVTMQPLAAEGEWKPITVYWLRRIMLEDVQKIEKPEADNSAEKGSV